MYTILLHVCCYQNRISIAYWEIPFHCSIGWLPMQFCVRCASNTDATVFLSLLRFVYRCCCCSRAISSACLFICTQRTYIHAQHTHIRLPAADGHIFHRNIPPFASAFPPYILCIIFFSPVSLFSLLDLFVQAPFSVEGR